MAVHGYVASEWIVGGTFMVFVGITTSYLRKKLLRRQFVHWVENTNNILREAATIAGLQRIIERKQIFDGYGKLSIPDLVQGLFDSWVVHVEVEPNSPQRFSHRAGFVIRVESGPKNYFFEFGEIRNVDAPKFDYDKDLSKLSFLVSMCTKVRIRSHMFEAFVPPVHSETLVRILICTVRVAKIVSLRT